jgi:hypothetical protein
MFDSFEEVLGEVIDERGLAFVLAALSNVCLASADGLGGRNCSPRDREAGAVYAGIAATLADAAAKAAVL